MSFTASTTVSYDGSEGEEHTVSEEQNFQETKEFPCPPRSRCLFKLITRKLDNVDMPFEATVQRNTEVRVMGNCNSNVAISVIIMLTITETTLKSIYCKLYINEEKTWLRSCLNV